MTGTIAARLRRALPLIGVVAAVLLAAFIPLPVPTPNPIERTIRVEASRFAYQPGIIRVNPGDRITIELTSVDVVHGLSVDGYNVELQADPGRVSSVSFIANNEGTFRLRCSVTCGDMHPFMVGKLQVGPNTLLMRASFLSVMLTAIGLSRSSRHGRWGK